MFAKGEGGHPRIFIKIMKIFGFGLVGRFNNAAAQHSFDPPGLHMI